MVDALVWLDRAALSALLTEQLRNVAGCQHASIVVGREPGRRSGREQLAQVHVPGAATSRSLLCARRCRWRRVQSARALQRARRLAGAPGGRVKPRVLRGFSGGRQGAVLPASVHGLRPFCEDGSCPVRGAPMPSYCSSSRKRTRCSASAVPTVRHPLRLWIQDMKNYYVDFYRFASKHVHFIHFKARSRLPNEVVAKVGSRAAGSGAQGE